MPEPEPAPSEIKLLRIACDEYGVAAVEFETTGGPGVHVIRWSNKNACGTPT